MVDDGKGKKKSLTTAHSPKNHRRMGGFDEKPDSSSRVLFFKKGDNFAYQNIAISPHYHMVVEEDHALHPRISILPNHVHQPPPPPGSNLPMNNQVVKHGPIGIFRTSLDRTTTVRNSKQDFDSQFSVSHHNKTADGFGGGTSQFSEISHDNFSKVNSKYGRLKEPVKMDNMLSREE